MGKKKKAKKAQVVGVGIQIPRGLMDAMVFAEDSGDCLDMIMAAREEQARQLREIVADAASPSPYEEAREEFFEFLTDEEIEAFDTLDNFAHSVKAGLPEDNESYEARLEHADWNTDEYRDDIAETVAGFEADIAYYIHLKDTMPKDNPAVDDAFEVLSYDLEIIVKKARVLELMMMLELRDFRIGLLGERSAEAKKILKTVQNDIDEANLEREVIFDQLEELYRDLDELGCYDGDKLDDKLDNEE